MKLLLCLTGNHQVYYHVYHGCSVVWLMTLRRGFGLDTGFIHYGDYNYTDCSYWLLTQLTTKYGLSDLTPLITATFLIADFSLRRLSSRTHCRALTLLIPNTHSRTNSHWIQRLTDFFRFQRLTDWLLWIAFPLQHRAVPMETLVFPLLVAMQPTCTQQYRSGELIHVTIRPRLLGNHATRQYRVVSVPMEVFNFQLPSNDSCV
jgi:hypothetical protein